MKTNLSKVYNKLPKQKIDLSSVAELERVSDMQTIDSTNLNELSDSINDLRNFDSKLEAAITAATDFVLSYEYMQNFYDMSNVSTIDNALSQFAANAQILGVDPKTVEIYNVLEEQYSEIIKFSEEVESFIDNNQADYEAAVKVALI